MPASTELPAQLGKYRIVRKLGEGGMGAVYLAEDTQARRPVALKVPHFGPGAAPAVLERFQREARVALGIDHANICPVLEIGQAGSIHYLTMPYIEGQPLSKLAGHGRPWPPGQAADLVRRLA